MPKRRKRPAGSQGEELIGLGVGVLTGYVPAEIILARSAHPIHWLIAAITGSLGYAGVWLWYRIQRSQRPR